MSRNEMTNELCKSSGPGNSVAKLLTKDPENKVTQCQVECARGSVVSLPNGYPCYLHSGVDGKTFCFLGKCLHVHEIGNFADKHCPGAYHM